MLSGGGATVSVIRGTVQTMCPPLPLLIIAQRWPSWLVVALAHDLPIAGAYFPADLHRHFKSKTQLTWYDVDVEIISQSLPDGAFTGLITGSRAFIQSVMKLLPSMHNCIVIVESPFRSMSSAQDVRRDLKRNSAFLRNLNMHTVTMAHADFGGCTSATHVIGFGRSICSADTIPTTLPNVHRNLSHCLDVAVEGYYEPQLPPPPLTGPPLRTYGVQRNGVQYAYQNTKDFTLRHESLLPCHDPSARILCPSVFAKAPKNFVCRQLTMKEALRVYSLPIQYDASLLGSAYSVDNWLPFESSISPDILTSLMEQLWGTTVGGLDSAVEGASAPSHGEVVSDEDTPQIAETMAAPVTSLDHVTELEVDTGRFQDVPTEAEMMEVDDGTDPQIDLTQNFKEVVFEAQVKGEAKLAEAKAQLKAAKADDAEVPVYLWNDVIKEGAPPREDRCDGCVDYAVSVLRSWGLKIYWKKLRSDCIQRLRENYGPEWFKLPRMKGGRYTDVGIEVEALSNIMWHATEANWFEYKSGSALHYFRFPLFYQGIAKDGVPIFFEKDGPKSMRAQPTINDEQARKVLRSKVGKVVKRRYLVGSGIRLRSLIKYFAVPKTDSDYRIVYDATANKLNEAVWAPSFWLPTVDTLVRYVDATTWMLDRDIGDMFLNFPLDKRAWPYTGLNLSSLFDGTEEEDEEIIKMAGSQWVHWGRCLMGFKPSPYNAIKTALVVEEVARGDRHCKSNPFQWDHIRLNLPGNADYDPSISWISKIRSDGLIACDIFTFVDDERLTGATRELVWQAGHRLAYIQSYFGIQDAARKLRLACREGGLWSGAGVHTIPELGVCVLTSEEKWWRFKDIIAKWLSRLVQGDKELDHKELMSDRGFCVHLCNSYPAMKPYLKGFHLTIEMWRGGRDEEGWKLPINKPSHQMGEEGLDFDSEDIDDESDDDYDDTDEALLEFKLDEGSPKSDGCDETTCDDVTETTASTSTEETEATTKPKFIGPRAPPTGVTTPARRFISDLKALMKLTESVTPPLRVVRSKLVFTAVYGFGDASGRGFCGTLGYHDHVNYRIGVWGKDDQSESSNYKELCNLVETCEEEAAEGRLYNAEFFLFTDNSTAESCFYRGSSTSKQLHELIVRLRKLEMEYNLTIHLIHVAGTRMIAQGTDGGSRGSLLEGVLSGKPMLDFVDLGKSAVERHAPLLDWIREWTNNSTLSALTPEEWFVEGHGIIGGKKNEDGIWIPEHEKPRQMHLWCPPPAVADAALEELLKARHKRTDTFHIIAIPRLVTPRWRRLFRKACDFACEIPAGSAHWPTNMYEPLWLGIVLPFSHHRPWQLKRAPLLVDMEREMRQVLRDGESDGGNILCKLLQLNLRLSKVSEDVARAVLRMPRREVRSEVSSEGNEG